ncbi:hypothetical protein GCM10018954_081710 [Kutzneria kofuensis]
MVLAQQQHVVVLAELDQRGPGQRALAQVERPFQLGLDIVDALQRNGSGRVDDLHDLAVDGVERRAQRLVPLHQGVQRRLQRRFVERAAQAQADAGVVLGVAGRQVVHQPQPPLRRRDRHRLGPRHPADPVLGGAGLRRQQFGDAGDRAGVEHDPRRQVDVEAGADPGQQFGAEDGVAAQFEEVVVDADLRHAEQLSPQPGEHGLRLGARRHVLGAARGRPVRLRQRLAVELPVGAQREAVQPHDRRRHHVVRQRGGEVGAQVRVGVGDHVADEPLHAGAVLAGDHHRVADVRVPAQRRLDLAQLDPEAADLDLVVGAADELQHAAGGPADEVAGAVHAAAWPRGVGAERAGDEPGSRQAGTLKVAAGQADTLDVQLPGDADTDRAQTFVQDMGLGVPDRAADG